jgi:two-component system sensor histidine kinase/response regulator
MSIKSGIQANLSYDELKRRALELEQLLTHAEERYTRLVENLSEEYVFYSRDKSGMITYISPSVEKVLGYSPEEASRNYKEFLTDHAMNKQALEHLELSLQGIAQPPYLNELYHRDGTTRIFYNSEIPILDKNNKVVAIEGIARDVTDTLKTEKDLIEQKERFRLLVETIEEVFWIHDLKKDKLLYVSPNYEKIYRRPCETLYANPGSFLKMIHHEDVERVKQAYKQIARGKGIDLEYRLLHPDGSITWIWSRSFIFPDEKKRPSLSIGTSLDVTERKNTEHEKTMLAAIVENTEDHAAIKDPDLRIIASNKANYLAAGKKKMEDILGKTDIELYGDHPHVRQYMEDDRKALKMKKGQTLVNEQLFIYPGDRKTHSLVKKFPVFNEKDQLLGVASISRDISNYKQALADLHESESRYRLLVENQNEGIGLLDKELNFIFANPSAENIFGVEKGKINGNSLIQFLPKDMRKTIRKQFPEIGEDKKKNLELEIVQHTGSKRLMDITISPHFRDDSFLGFFTVFRDITDWKKAENDLKSSERILREANAAKDKFFSIIAHDLKNPFHSIQGFADLLIKHYSSYDQEEVLTIIKMIRDASRQAYNILENLLHWSRAQTGRIRFEAVETDINELVDQTMLLMESSAKEKNISLINQVNKGTHAFCDPKMISTVIRNLISNGIKFTRPTGKVTVSAKPKGKSLEIYVSDNGAGIEEENAKKLFHIDSSFSTSGTANEEGTGLGLILCKEFAEINNGTLTFTSKPGKGTTFVISLPGKK